VEQPLVQQHMQCHWIGLLNIRKDFQVLSRFIQKLIQPPACSDHGLYRILSSYWLAPFYLLKKIRQRAELFWFGLRDVGILKIFHSRAVIQRTIVDYPTFLKHGPAEKIPVCAHTYRDPN
jgi:hypothetical protein